MLTRSDFLFLTFFFFFFSSVGLVAEAIPSDEISALLAIKSKLVDPLEVLRDWVTPTAGPEDAGGGRRPRHCSWTGVHCDSSGSVDSLNLGSMNLSGVIADEIAGLSNLAGFNFCCNAFSSSLPRTLANLTMLRNVDISDNNFVGEFPGDLSSWPELTSLNASANNFDGPLPAGDAKSPLEVLDVRGNFFSGSLQVSYKNLRKLKYLGLSGNNLTGKLPPELGEMTSLETLIIGYNEFEGPIPAELGKLAKLQYLDIAIANLDGAIPAELGKLQFLTTVFLYKNNLNGEIPREIGNLTSLQMLDLSDNQLTGGIPPELAKLTNLQLLNLMCNRLKGPVPTGVGDLPLLEVLELWNNTLTGPLPANLGRNSPLQWVDVSTNSLSGKIPDGLCEGQNLTKLIIFNNGFSGPIPVSLTTCSSLVRVRFQNNRLNGTIPIGLGSLLRLQRLELAGNDLSGEIPEDLSTSPSLSFIDLSHNHFQFSVPSSILSMPTLQNFLASDNELTGGIPNDSESCPSLTSVDLSDNRLSGRIPSSLASCERLVNLNLSNNRLEGEIPTALAQMPTLSILDLSNNLLNGSMPENFGSSPALETLNLAYNNLSGLVPSTGLLKTINPDELAGNSGLCGGVLTPCAKNSPWNSSPASRRILHIKHIAAGWLIGITAVLAIMIGFLGARRLYTRWFSDGFFEEESGAAWPWRLTAFQRLNFASTDVLACIKESNIIGMGATGVVYKADLQKHQSPVAVKKLWCTAAGDDLEGDGGARVLATEVSMLGRLRHRNIVRMIGYLRNDTEMMILYEYMSNGSLWEALHGRREKGGAGDGGRLLVDWVARYSVAYGVAEGLAYLHHDCHPPVIHRDVKSSNVLLDSNLDARIADFGLARSMLRKNETFSTVAGSYGYIAPEYGYTMKVDEKSDIYSFGVVLLELLTGKKPIEPDFGEFHDLVGWVRRQQVAGRDCEELLDASVGGRSPHVREEMMLVLKIAMLCTAKLPKDRPSIRDVLTMLGEAKPRRKSSSGAAVTSNVVAKDKPVFTTSPDSDYL